jgi:hypothetical protein
MTPPGQTVSLGSRFPLATDFLGSGTVKSIEMLGKSIVVSQPMRRLNLLCGVSRPAFER